MSDRKHWDTVYETKGSENVSWFRPHLDRSLAFLESAKIPRSANVIDVGGGASTLVDDLLDRGYSNVTVLDLSEAALQTARARLGDRAERVQWIRGDVTEVPLSSHAYD